MSLSGAVSASATFERTMRSWPRLRSRGLVDEGGIVRDYLRHEQARHNPPTSPMQPKHDPQLQKLDPPHLVHTALFVVRVRITDSLREVPGLFIVDATATTATATAPKNNNPTVSSFM